MPTHGSAAKSARLHKEKFPEAYCPERNCLWQIWVLRRGERKFNPCRNHPNAMRNLNIS